MTLTEIGSSTDVEIDSNGVDPGVYTVQIESFDNNSNIKSTLKTDTIEITVAAGPPLFESEPVFKGLLAGEA